MTNITLIYLVLRCLSTPSAAACESHTDHFSRWEQVTPKESYYLTGQTNEVVLYIPVPQLSNPLEALQMGDGTCVMGSFTGRNRCTLRHEPTATSTSRQTQLWQCLTVSFSPAVGAVGPVPFITHPSRCHYQAPRAIRPLRCLTSLGPRRTKGSRKQEAEHGHKFSMTTKITKQTLSARNLTLLQIIRGSSYSYRF